MTETAAIAPKVSAAPLPERGVGEIRQSLKIGIRQKASFPHLMDNNRITEDGKEIAKKIFEEESQFGANTGQFVEAAKGIRQDIREELTEYRKEAKISVLAALAAEGKTRRQVGKEEFKQRVKNQIANDSRVQEAQAMRKLLSSIVYRAKSADVSEIRLKLKGEVTDAEIDARLQELQKLRAEGKIKRVPGRELIRNAIVEQKRKVLRESLQAQEMSQAPPDEEQNAHAVGLINRVRSSIDLKRSSLRVRVVQAALSLGQLPERIKGAANKPTRIAAGVAATIGAGTVALGIAGAANAESPVLPPPPPTPISGNPPSINFSTPLTGITILTKTVAFSPTAELPKAAAQETKQEIKGGALLKDKIMPSLQKEAALRRQKAQQNDPEWKNRIEKEIAEDTVNFLFLGIGSEQDAQMTDTIMLVSYSLKENTVRLFSIPRDVHAPEIDRFLQEKGNKDARFNAINTAYDSGGYPLIKKVVEDATGLPVDFTANLSIRGVIDFMDRVFGKIKVTLKEPLDDEFLNLHIPAGTQELDGNRLYGFLASRRSTSEDARNQRQQEAVGIITNALEEKWKTSNDVQKALILSNLGLAFVDLQKNKQLGADFDINRLFINQLFEMGKNYIEMRIKGQNLIIDKPAIQKLVFDEEHGTTWEKRASKERPHLKTVYEGDYLAPDLVKGYWKTFRGLVKEQFAK